MKLLLRTSLAALTVLTMSCTAHRQLVYLDSRETGTTDDFYPYEKPEYRCRTGIYYILKFIPSMLK
jgi:hypothetical protein